MSRCIAFLTLLLLAALPLWGQGRVQGRLTAAGKPLRGAQVLRVDDPAHPAVTDSAGRYALSLPEGSHKIVAIALGYRSEQRTVLVPPTGSLRADFALEPLEATLEAVTVETQRLKSYGIRRLGTVEDFGLYEAKKSEVILLKDLTANQATNNARQIYAKVPGLNIWESDQAGLQLGVGGRGLSPNRTNNFNTRQNGYDISADALGYPESYYTPPPEATEQIEIVRGAAALQYGTQFGGMLNFRLKEPDTTRRLGLELRQTAGSWGFSNTHLGASGRVGTISYASYYQHKQSDGWRPNSSFRYDMARALVRYRPSARFSVTAEYTFMAYLARQAGGLTDALFAKDARQSLRTRNWFRVDWNLFALTTEYHLTEKTRVNLRLFGLVARRQALGNLERITVQDQSGTPRDLIDGRFRNLGAEARIVHEGRLLGRAATLLAGVRLYRGYAQNLQGKADSGSGPSFRFNSAEPDGSSYRFPSGNGAAFAEMAWAVTDRLSLVPGVRTEYIVTTSQGKYDPRPRFLRPDSGGPLWQEESLRRARGLVLFGLGAGYKPRHGRWEAYANICQNYRAINFNDIRIDNPSLRIDSNIRDERGYSADIGIRSRKRSARIQYDVSAFYIRYNQRIGTILRADEAPVYREYNYRSNIGDAEIRGIEAYVEADLLRLVRALHGADTVISPYSLTVYSSTGYLNSRYVRSQQVGVTGREVELVPSLVQRAGITFGSHRLRLSFQVSYTGRQFTDATNALRTSSAVIGQIPAYTVADLTAQYRLSRHLRLEASCNNLFDARYFTRRADSYPGPGIIPADARSYYGTLVVVL